MIEVNAAALAAHPFLHGMSADHLGLAQVEFGAPLHDSLAEVTRIRWRRPGPFVPP